MSAPGHCPTCEVLLPMGGPYSACPYCKGVIPPCDDPRCKPCQRRRALEEQTREGIESLQAMPDAE